MGYYEYFDAVAYFQDKLNAICAAMNIPQYKVTLERKIDAENARVIVLAALAGAVGSASAEMTYELNAYTNSPEEVMQMLTQLARSESGKVFEGTSVAPSSETIVYHCIASYLTPTIAERDIEIGANHGVRVVQYVKFGFVTDSMDIDSITYMGSEIEFAQGTINYVAQLSANNKSGQNLMKNASTGAALSLTLTLPSQRNALAANALAVMLGEKDRNFAFSIEVKIGGANGFDVTKNFIVSTGTLNSVRGAIPSIQVSFVEYDG